VRSPVTSAFSKASLALVAWLACRPAAEPGGIPGQPLARLTDAELGRFLLGRAVFERRTTPEEGLGPLYNAERCSDCHLRPAAGGSGPALVLKATRYREGTCDLLVAEGGDNVQQHATPALARLGIAAERVPSRATDTMRLAGPALFGLGLLEAIPEEAILAREDPGDRDGDGISGRAARTADGRLARFGRKGETATVIEFVETALRLELGLTTPAHPAEETVNGVPVPNVADPAPDPEIDRRGMELLADYVRFLAPPAPESVPRDQEAAFRQGEQLFSSIGCARCHVPEWRTGASEVVALRHRRIRPYTDLLLHDLGPGLAGACGAGAAPAEYRTAPLWGLRFRDRLLHDGRATTLLEAIAAHGGEAEAARQAFARLPPEQQAWLLAFLGVL